MKKRKILFSFMGFIFVVVTMLTACTAPNADVSIIENTFYSQTIYSASSGKVTENIVLNFDALSISQSEIDNVINSVFMICMQTKNSLTYEFNDKIALDTESEISSSYFDIATEKKNNQIAFTIYYYTTSAWQYFYSFEGVTTSPQIITHLFEYTRIDKKDMVGTVTSLGGTEQYFGNYFKTRIFTFMDSYDSSILNALEVKSVYSYATTYARRRTNAPMLAYYENMYFHIWDTTSDNVEFEFSYNVARVESWYILSLIIAVVTVVIILLISKKDKSKTIKLEKEENSLPENYDKESEDLKSRIKTKNE